MTRHESPVEKFPGHIILPEFLTLPQVMAFEAALGSIDAIVTTAIENKQERVWFTPGDTDRLKVVLLVVKEWHILGVPEQPSLETFPFSPRKASHDLLTWVFRLVRDLWAGESVPNA